MVVLSVPIFWWRAEKPAPATTLQAIGLARPVKKGQKIVFGDLELVPPAPGTVSENFLERVAGSYAARDLESGHRLAYSDLEWSGRLKARVPVGKLAYPVAVETDLPLAEGDLVDLFMTQGAESERLQGVRVIDGRIPRQPILALTDDQIRWVEMARRKGKLGVAVRNEHDRDFGAKPRRFFPSRRGPDIQIWEPD